MRKTEFAIGEYYHIFNRGVDKRDVFLCNNDYTRFFTSVKEFNVKKSIGSLKDLRALRARQTRSLLGDGLLEPDGLGKLVEIICYCFNSNHYHFILKQLEEKGIEKFMHKLGMGYTNYFNTKYDRSGSLFQGPFKSTHISTNELLLYLSVYVNANHQIHGYSEKNWAYSSLLDYTGKRDGKLCKKEFILDQFDNNFSEYEKYLNENALYFKEKKEMEKYILE
jgi:hypothetical protein